MLLDSIPKAAPNPWKTISIVMTFATFIAGMIAFFIHFIVVPSGHSQRNEVTMVFLIGPGASQDIKAYMEKGDRLNLTWSSNGPDLGYQIQLEDGHSPSRVLEIGISAKGENRFSAYHGGIHSISFKNFSRQQVTLTTKATGTFEYFRPSPHILKAGLDD